MSKFNIGDRVTWTAKNGDFTDEPVTATVVRVGDDPELGLGFDYGLKVDPGKLDPSLLAFFNAMGWNGIDDAYEHEMELLA